MPDSDAPLGGEFMTTRGKNGVVPRRDLACSGAIIERTDFMKNPLKIGKYSFGLGERFTRQAGRNCKSSFLSK